VFAGSFGALTLAAESKVHAAMIGTRHSHASGKLRVLAQSPDYEFAGVSEPDSRAREQRAADAAYRGVRWLTEEEVLRDSSITAIAVESLVWENLGWGRKVIAAGKHLHLEKPPTNDIAAFRELIEEARRKRLLVQTGYIWRWHEGINRAFDAVRQGWLGDVYMLRGTINTDIDANSRENVARYKGGMMYELGSHVIDRVVDLWGRPRNVKSWIRHDSKLPDRLADNTLAVLEYDRSLAVVSSSARMPGHTAHRSLELIGTDGAIVLQPIEPGTRMRVSMREARGPYKAGWQDVEFPAQVRYVGDLQEFARAIRTSTPLKHSYDFEMLVEETILRASGEISA
jgi:predicted dehydrogenase